MDIALPAPWICGSRSAVAGCLLTLFGAGSACTGTVSSTPPPADDDAADDDDATASGAPLEHVDGAGALTPAFSVDRGFHDQPFEVEIAVDLNDATIRYTLDGSDPRTAANAVEGASPLQVFVDPYSDEGRDPAPGVVLRAVGRWQGVLGEPVSHTYLFIGDSAALSPDDAPPGPGWPEIYDTSNNLDPLQAINYGLDPRVVEDPAYAELLDDALLAIPTLSLATELEHLFDPGSGIYVNALEHGMDWERPVSIELLDPDDNGVHSGEFQVNGGLRIRGGLGHAYYVGVETAMPAVPGMATPVDGVCVAPIGMEEGTEASIPEREFGMVVGEQVEFRFLSSTTRKEDPIGTLLDGWGSGEIEELAPVQSTMDDEGEDAGEETIPVTLHTQVTEVGTLDLELRSRDGRTWKLEYNVRS